MRTAATLLLVSALSLGCSSTKTIARLQNAYDFWEGQYEDACVTVPIPAPPPCHEIRASLLKFKRDLNRAVWVTGPDGKQVPRTGPIPLQLDLCSKDERDARRLILGLKEN